MNALKAESILTSIEEQAFDVRTAETCPIDPWLQKRITIEANRVLRGEAKTVCYLEAAQFLEAKGKMAMWKSTDDFQRDQIRAYKTTFNRGGKMLCVEAMAGKFDE